ncbi:hypothetical protein PV10_08135 [Exophiala mesophila]|uniref:Methyltransferase n=1 Tax=Exophiala mesophila TaxID=212818 RepID=A0A0D1Z0Y6_EXOME|nr:uncharacterized protein PV10_08135 [Exophiala mesophila]KIV88452.1 hypothetical protein PV10_08135 [Exophiala mesophila]
MPDIVTSIGYLADLDLYKREKPYCVLVSPEQAANLPPDTQTSNLEFEQHENILVKDIRDCEPSAFGLDKTGFEVVTDLFDVSDIQGWSGLRQYQTQTEKFLRAQFGVDRVVCWEVTLRHNVQREAMVVDLNDWTIPDGPAAGAHNDVTAISGPNIIADHLPEELKAVYHNGGYRFRIVNTWRPLLASLEDNPLALCDFRSVDPDDLVPADRVIPSNEGEVYYLKYNPDQKWYWLDSMTMDELFIFIMYDSEKGPQARYCPHVPVKNPRAPAEAPPRKSVETRSILISKVADT